MFALVKISCNGYILSSGNLTSFMYYPCYYGLSS